MSILFLNRDTVLQIHLDQINLYGGDPSLRDQSLLDSAIAIPQAAFGAQWLHEFPDRMAAAYLFHIVANHPFVDGNKRTGASTALVFLQINDFKLASSHDELYDLVLSVAQGTLIKSRVVEFFKRHVTR